MVTPTVTTNLLNNRSSELAQPTIETVTAKTLPEFAAFLHANLEAARSTRAWAAGLGKSWGMSLPNHGFALRDAERIVGGSVPITRKARLRDSHSGYAIARVNVCSMPIASKACASPWR